MGANYEKAHRTNQAFNSNGNIAANTTTFIFMAGAGVVAATRHLVSTNLVISRMYVMTSAAPGAGETFTYTLMVNNIATALAVQLAGAAQTTGTDLVNAVALVPGDYYNIRVETSLNAAVTRHAVGVEERT